MKIFSYLENQKFYIRYAYYGLTTDFSRKSLSLLLCARAPSAPNSLHLQNL